MVNLDVSHDNPSLLSLPDDPLIYMIDESAETVLIEDINMIDMKNNKIRIIYLFSDL
jgi:hypothetical protein